MKKRISALLLSVVLCLGMLSITTSAYEVKGTEGTKNITITGAAPNALCALWGDESFTQLLLLFYTDSNGAATITVDTDLALNSTYYVGVQGETGNAKAVTIEPSTTPITPSIPGGGSGTTRYNVKVPASVPNGSVTLNPTRAKKGETVTITVTPDKGYELDTLTVKDSSGKEIELTKVSKTEYSFVMPARTVTVTPVFKEKTPWVNPFTDVLANAWYYDAVSFVCENGLMNGYDNGKFGPLDTLSRSMLAQILYNKEGRPEVTGTSTFPDVPANTWYTDAVIWATEKGIVKGYGDGTFAPDDPITREQLATILCRYEGSPETSIEKLDFSDADQVSDWALEGMKWAVENEVVHGKGNNILDPLGSATRSEVAQMLMNYLDK